MSNLQDVEQHSRQWRGLFLGSHLCLAHRIGSFSIGHASFTMKALVSCGAWFATGTFHHTLIFQPLN